ncbi:MAG: hypothetical protein ACXW4B_08735 [Micavibrio sp.]
MPVLHIAIENQYSAFRGIPGVDAAQLDPAALRQSLVPVMTVGTGNIISLCLQNIRHALGTITFPGIIGAAKIERPGRAEPSVAGNIDNATG